MADKQTYVLITGCTPGGIGHALALEFQKRGCHVIATARKPDVLQSLADLGMTAIPLEVTSPESIAACRAQVDKLTGGRLDILVNNAGRSYTIPATDIDIDQVRSTYDTNVFGPMLMCQAFVGLLSAARGLIINISSLGAVVPYLFRSVYSSTKAAIESYSRNLRLELQPFNVRVMVAKVGTVKSNIADRVEPHLPGNSLFRPAERVFRALYRFSQENGTLPTEVFAEKLVTAALKGEGFLGGRIGGSPNWFWAGGLVFLVRSVSSLPEWLTDLYAYYFFGMGNIKRLITAAKKGD